MNSSDDGDGTKPATAKKDTANKMKQSDSAGDQPTLTDKWWDGQLKALYQSVLDEPLPDDMMELVHAPKRKPGDAKAKGSRKPEDE